MQRREFITLFGGTTITHVMLPQLARAQTPTRSPLIAVLGAVTREQFPTSFVEGLRGLGYVEGDNIDVAYRFSDGRDAQLPALAEELIHLSPRLIMAAVTPAAVAARRLTETIPIVCPLLENPVELGLIASMSRPGGNVTGIMTRVEGLAGKQLELAARLVPAPGKVGLIASAVAVEAAIDRQRLEVDASQLGIELVSIEVREPNDLDAAFQRLSSEHVRAVVVLPAAMFFQERKRIAGLAASVRLPTVYGFRDHVDAGGLISYGVNYRENFRAAAIYVVKIIRGAKPADLPVEFPSKLELVVNLKAAKALGFEIPSALLVSADEVIE
jgi:putative ABC transport system substrate-binding protein